ncbi:unnamed protein product [Heterobilharzia americana]|nr:unnamed protein product [Heterobilharzia americana]
MMFITAEYHFLNNPCVLTPSMSSYTISNHRPNRNISENLQIHTNESEDLPSISTFLPVSKHQAFKQKLSGSYSLTRRQYQTCPRNTAYCSSTKHIRERNGSNSKLLKQTSTTCRNKSNMKLNCLRSNKLDILPSDGGNNNCDLRALHNPILFDSDFPKIHDNPIISGNKSQLNNHRKRIYAYGPIKSKKCLQYSPKRVKKPSTNNLTDLKLELFKNQLFDSNLPPTFSSINEDKNNLMKIMQTEDIYSDEIPSKQHENSSGDNLYHNKTSQATSAAYEVGEFFQLNSCIDPKDTKSHMIDTNYHQVKSSSEESQNYHLKHLLTKKLGQSTSALSPLSSSMKKTPQFSVDYELSFQQISQSLQQNIKKQLHGLPNSMFNNNGTINPSQLSCLSSYSSMGYDKPLDLRNPTHLDCNTLSPRKNQSTHNYNKLCDENRVVDEKFSSIKSINLNEIWSAVLLWLHRKQNEHSKIIQGK